MLSIIRERICEFFSGYKSIYKIFQSYWRNYGGISAVLSSLYFHISIFMTFIILNSNKDNINFLDKWMDSIISISPSLIGISLTGMAVFLAIGDDDFKNLIRGEGEKGDRSPMMSLIATFTHFVLLQAFSVINAVFGKACGLDVLLYKAFSVWLFTYALVTIIAAIMAVYRVAKWYDSV